MNKKQKYAFKPKIIKMNKKQKYAFKPKIIKMNKKRNHFQTAINDNIKISASSKYILTPLIHFYYFDVLIRIIIIHF